MPAPLRYVADKAIALLRQALGFREYGNNGNPYSKWQYGDEFPDGGWCCSFSSWIAYMAGFRFGSGATHGDKGFSHTDRYRDWAQLEGLWRDRNAHFKPGDPVIFDWNGDGSTDHIEQTEHDDGALIVTIGGNTGNAVARRVRDRRYIVGGVALSESKQAKPQVDPAVWTYLAHVDAWLKHLAKHPLRLRDRSDDVLFLNQLLVAGGWMAEMPSDPAYYSGKTRQGVYNVKRIRKMSNRNGKLFGWDAGKVLTAG